METEAQPVLSSEQPLMSERIGGQSALFARGLKPVAELGNVKPHGTRLRYLAGCKCLQCRMANSNYETTRARARAAGDWNGVISTDEARAHINKLSRAGVGYKIVADAAGVARSVVMGIRSGKRTHARARTIRKILQVTKACRGDAALVSAVQTCRYINLLIEEGYTRGNLALMLGRKTKSLQIGKDRVTVRTAADIAALYRRLTT